MKKLIKITLVFLFTICMPSASFSEDSALLDDIFKYCEIGDIAALQNVLDKKASSTWIGHAWPWPGKYVKKSASGKSITFPDMTPLHVAALNGQTDTVKYLVKTRKMKVDTTIKTIPTPLAFATVAGHKETCQALLEMGADVKYKTNEDITLLMLAARRGHISLMNVLLEAGADVNQHDIKGRTVLAHAINNGHVKAVEFLLEKQVKLELGDLNVAVETGNVTLVELLLKAGCPVLFSQTYGWKNEGYCNALLSAARNGNVEIINMLIKTGVDINAQYMDYYGDGRSVLMQAAEINDDKAVALLLQSGADINAQSRITQEKDNYSVYGRSALMLAAENGNITVIEALLEAGANVRLYDTEGYNVLGYLKRNKKLTSTEKQQLANKIFDLMQK